MILKNNQMLKSTKKFRWLKWIIKHYSYAVFCLQFACVSNQIPTSYEIVISSFVSHEILQRPPEKFTFIKLDLLLTARSKHFFSFFSCTNERSLLFYHGVCSSPTMDTTTTNALKYLHYYQYKKCKVSRTKTRINQ